MRLTAFVLAFAVVVTVHAQTPAPAPAATPPPPGPQAMKKTTASMVLDGELNDAIWKDAVVIDTFYETSPSDNIPAKVKTVAYVTYDERYFYIGVRCDDPDPGKIRAPYVDRDGVIGTDDNIAIFLDPRNDKRSAIELRVNPRGIQADGIFNDANFNEDFAPDFFYDTVAKIDAGGWSAEFRIPFSSLRYPETDPQTWNILVWRNYPRDFRYAFHSAPIPRGTNCHICHLHPLTGMTGLPEGTDITAAPYVTAQALQHPTSGLGSPRQTDPVRTDIGLDFKWTPTADDVLDVTLNPDFSQVETDVPQITVNQRFAVFFPEKRPFFLEGFDLFDAPLQVAYTRTIQSPRWGARGTGQVAGAQYTFLLADDRGGGVTILPGPLGSGFAPADFESTSAIGRVRKDVGSGYVGAVLTARQIDGGGHNRVIGPDFQWRPNDFDSLTAQLLYSDTQNPDRPELSPAYDGASLKSHALAVSFSRNKRTYDYFADVRDIGDEFRADLGFVPQVGYREVDGGFGLRFYPENSRLRFIRPSIFVDWQGDRDNNTLFQQVSLAVNVQGVRNLAAGIAIRPRERVGNEEQTYAQWSFQIDPSRRFPRIFFNGRAGQSIDFENGGVGDGASLGLGATLRPTDKLELQPSFNREWLDRDGGRVYTARIERLRMVYSFSAKSLVRVIGQYVTTERDPSLYVFDVPRHGGSFLGTILYSYKLNWQTVLFVGYGDDRVLTNDERLLPNNRSLFFKVSYAVQR